MSGDPVGRLTGLVFVAVGLFIRYLPTKTLLQFDRRTGYALYKNAPDEKTGVDRARKFYRWFGLLFIVIGASAFILTNLDYLPTIFK